MDGNILRDVLFKSSTTLNFIKEPIGKWTPPSCEMLDILLSTEDQNVMSRRTVSRRSVGRALKSF